MNLTKFTNGLLMAIFLLVGTTSSFAQTEVTGSSGNYKGKVNGKIVYSGSKYYDAINAVCNKAGNGAKISINASGISGNDNGGLYAIRPLAGQTLDFRGNTVECTKDDLVVGIYADGKDGITIKNIKMKGAPRYGMWFRGCSNVTISGASLDLKHSNSAGDGIRVDDRGGSKKAKNLKIQGSVKITGTKLHAIETYGVSGVSIGNVRVDNTGGCGVLLNKSSNCTIGTVTGVKNNERGGYATFRVANKNGKTTCSKVISRSSGRGFFSVSGSQDCTVKSVDIRDAKNEGIYMQDSRNIKVEGGSISNSGGPNVRIRNSSGSYVRASFSGSIAKSASSDEYDNKDALTHEEIARLDEQELDEDSKREFLIIEGPLNQIIDENLMDVSVFPNPAQLNSEITLTFPTNEGEKEVTLINLQGSVLQTTKFSGSQGRLSVEKPGVFMILVKSNEQSFTKRLIVQ